MKIILILLIFMFGTANAVEQIPVQKHNVNLSSFDLDSVPVSQVIRLIYMQSFITPYVLYPEVLEDTRLVSFRFNSEKSDLKSFLIRFLSSLGYEIEMRAGVDYVHAIPKEQVGQVNKEFFVYKPKFRDASFLIDLIAPLLNGSFTSKRSVQPAIGAKPQPDAAAPFSAAAQIDRNSDLILYEGSAPEVAKLKKILEQVDVPTGELLVKAVVYEVQTGRSDGTAFGLAASILGGKLGMKIGSNAALENSVSIGPASFQAVFSALATDNRFKVMSSPSVRVQSGKNARFTVGQDVPVLGSLSYPQGAGQAVQSVEYRSSGVILDLTPHIRENIIDLDLTQQLSNFVTTSSGVNNSPTLIKRELKTSISGRDGDLILIGGLSENKQSDTHDGLSFLPSFLHSKTSNDAKTELLLVMQINKM